MTNQQQIAVIELEGVTVDRLVVSSHDSATRSFADNAVDLPWRNFLKTESGTKSQREVP